MNQKKNTAQENLNKLQSHTIAVLGKIVPDPTIIDPQTFSRLFQELQTYQVELEMQNDELMLVNEQLDLQRQRFASIYDLAPIGYFITGLKGEIQELNSAAADLFGSDKQMLIGKSLYSLVAEDDRDTYYLFFRKLLTSTKKENCQLKLHPRRNKQVFVHAEGIAVRGGSQCYIALTDITPTMQVKQDLMKASHRLSLALDASGSGTWELDLSDMAFSFDRVIEVLLKFPPEQRISFQEVAAAVDAEDRQRFEQDCKSAMFDLPVDATYCFTCAAQSGRYVWVRGGLKETLAGQRILSGIMTDVTERKARQDHEEKLAEEHQRALVMARHAAEEKERNRISGALHDSVSQLLYGIQIKLGQVTDQKSGAALKEIKQLMQEAIRLSRNISFELAPSILIDFGLPAAVEELAMRLSNADLKIHVRITGFNGRLSPALETNIFRVVLELVNNCIKHASASLIDITLRQTAGKIEINVTDNGTGFPATLPYAHVPGSGLDAVNNRIGLYGGNMEILPAGENGTTIRIEIQNN